MAKKKKRVNRSNTSGIVKKRTRIKYNRIIIVLILLSLIIYFIYKITDHSINNIYVTGNYYLEDNDIIELAGLEKYPSTFTILSSNVENKLEDDKLILNANVSKEGLFTIHIDIKENKPLFYNINTNKTVLKDGLEVDKKYDVPVLINYVPDDIYEKFIIEAATIDQEILTKISEIEYKPNEVDENLFYLTMKDGNYVYLTLNKFTNINQYLDIITKFPNQKGILYLDSGEYFEVKDIK